MKAVTGAPGLSNQPQGGSNKSSESGRTTPTKGFDNLHARLRRLELRLTEIDAKLSIVQRDTWRIEKKQQVLPSRPPGNGGPPEPQPALESALFGEGV